MLFVKKPKYSSLTACMDLGHCSRTCCLQQLILGPTLVLWILDFYPLKWKHFKIIKVNELSIHRANPFRGKVSLRKARICFSFVVFFFLNHVFQGLLKYKKPMLLLKHKKINLNFWSSVLPWLMKLNH